MLRNQASPERATRKTRRPDKVWINPSVTFTPLLVIIPVNKILIRLPNTAKGTAETTKTIFFIIEISVKYAKIVPKASNDIIDLIPLHGSATSIEPVEKLRITPSLNIISCNSGNEFVVG